MADPEDVCIVLWRVCDLGKRWYAVVAGELENVGWELDDVDVDIATLQRIDTSSSIDRVLVLIDLNHVVELVWAVLVPAEVIKIEPVRLATLASHNSHSRDVATRKLAGQELKWSCAKIFVCTIELGLLPGHEEIDDI